VKYRIVLHFTATVAEDVEVQSEAELWQYKEDMYDDAGAEKIMEHLSYEGYDWQKLED
jgi:hypothetical protein